jgi:hypothetical protein
MKKITRMETMDSPLFQPLSDEELALAMGGKIEATAEVTYGANGWDAKGDIRITF